MIFTGGSCKSYAKEKNQIPLLESYHYTLDDRIVKSRLREIPINDILKLEKIGKGSTASVSKCYNLELQHIFSMKSLKVDDIDSSNFILFDNEINILENHRSEYLPKFLGKFYKKSSKGYYKLIIFKEYERFCLGTIGSKQFYIHEIIYIFISLLEVLIELEKLLIYHSDIKPENIVFRERDKKFILIDFGGSQIVKSNEDKYYMYDDFNFLCGTKNYSSPEKSNFIKNGTKSVFDPFKCDLWSLTKTIEKIAKKNMQTGDQQEKIFTFIKKILVEDFIKRPKASEVLEMIHQEFSEFIRNDIDWTPFMENPIQNVCVKNDPIKFSAKYAKANLFQEANEIAVLGCYKILFIGNLDNEKDWIDFYRLINLRGIYEILTYITSQK